MPPRAKLVIAIGAIVVSVCLVVVFGAQDMLFLLPGLHRAVVLLVAAAAVAGFAAVWIYSCKAEDVADALKAAQAAHEKAVTGIKDSQRREIAAAEQRGARSSKQQLEEEKNAVRRLTEENRRLKQERPSSEPKRRDRPVQSAVPRPQVTIQPPDRTQAEKLLERFRRERDLARDNERAATTEVESLRHQLGVLTGTESALRAAVEAISAVALGELDSLPSNAFANLDGALRPRLVAASASLYTALAHAGELPRVEAELAELEQRSRGTLEDLLPPTWELVRGSNLPRIPDADAELFLLIKRLLTEAHDQKRHLERELTNLTRTSEFRIQELSDRVALLNGDNAALLQQTRAARQDRNLSEEAKVRATEAAQRLVARWENFFEALVIAFTADDVFQTPPGLKEMAVRRGHQEEDISSLQSLLVVTVVAARQALTQRLKELRAAQSETRDLRAPVADRPNPRLAQHAEAGRHLVRELRPILDGLRAAGITDAKNPIDPKIVSRPEFNPGEFIPAIVAFFQAAIDGVLESTSAAYRLGAEETDAALLHELQHTGDKLYGLGLWLASVGLYDRQADPLLVTDDNQWAPGTAKDFAEALTITGGEMRSQVEANMRAWRWVNDDTSGDATTTEEGGSDVPSGNGSAATLS